MLITAGEVRYEVRFFHDQEYHEATLPMSGKTVWVRATVCEIYDASEYETVANAEPLEVGVSEANIADNFSRARGCKDAFERAIADFPRFIRKEFWREYFKVYTNGKRKGR